MESNSGKQRDKLVLFKVRNARWVGIKKVGEIDEEEHVWIPRKKRLIQVQRI
jgi:hypothetical protein